MVTTPVILKPLVLLWVLLGLWGCATNPVTGRNELSFISESAEIGIGEQQYLPSQQSQGGKYLVDQNLNDYVSEIGNRLAAVSDRALPYEFVVLNESTPNAWALPGGKIAVNRGLLLALNNEAELAAVLGHEIVHSAARHGAQAMQRGTLLQGAILATSIVAKDSEYSNYIVGAAELGSQLVSLRYGRDKELESDAYGIEYMLRAGYDPRAAVTLQETFVAMSDAKKTGWLEGLFSSHPPSVERVNANQQSVSAIDLRQDLETGEQRYTQHLAYLRSVESAYVSYDRAQFLIEEKQFESALKALALAQKIEPKEARFYGTMGDLYRLQLQHKKAKTAYDRALVLDQGFYAYYLGRGLSNAKLGYAAAAKSDLSKSNELLPTAVAMSELGTLSLAGGETGVAKQYFKAAMSAGGDLGRKAGFEYVKLDLPDNPSSYIRAQAKISNGYLGANLINKSGLTIGEVRVRFTTLLNGKSVSRTVKVKQLQRSATVNSGWQVPKNHSFEDVSLTILSARL
jgi:predicted Zn-dependent protease